MPHTRGRYEKVEVTNDLPGFTIRRYQPGDEAKILELFNRVFGANNPSFVPRGPAHWNWEFPGNPNGMQVMVAFEEKTGAMVGHYAGIPRRMICRGSVGIGSESVDSMVDPRARAALRRPGLFVVMALRWFHDFGDGGNLFAYGLPIESAGRIGSAFLTYRVVHHQLALEREASAARAGAGGLADVAEVTDFDARFDDLWARAAPDLSIATIRDSQYLRWRFRDHPTNRYRIGVVGDARALRGYAVTRRGSFDDRDDELLVDFLVPHGDLETARALLRWAGERASEDGAARLTAVMPPTSRWFLELQRLGFLVRGTKYEWSVAWEKRPLDPAVLRREWWYTLADTDLA